MSKRRIFSLLLKTIGWINYTFVHSISYLPNLQQFCEQKANGWNVCILIFNNQTSFFSDSLGRGDAGDHRQHRHVPHHPGILHGLRQRRPVRIFHLVNEGLSSIETEEKFGRETNKKIIWRSLIRFRNIGPNS